MYINIARTSEGRKSGLVSVQFHVFHQGADFTSHSVSKAQTGTASVLSSLRLDQSQPGSTLLHGDLEIMTGAHITCASNQTGASSDLSIILKSK